MDYIIGAGAILETGDPGSITPASLHANVDAAIARSAQAVAIDFESTSAETLQRLFIVAPGWNASQFRVEVTQPLQAQRTCTLADVLLRLADATQAPEVHLFAHYFPDEQTGAALAKRGITLIAHPLESIEAASVVAGQRCKRWGAVPAA